MLVKFMESKQNSTIFAPSAFAWSMEVNISSIVLHSSCVHSKTWLWSTATIFRGRDTQSKRWDGYGFILAEKALYINHSYNFSTCFE